MATPRLFVSSTCYDLQEIRFQLRNFIREFGYDAVMSEFDDIFYNYESHVQDSCLDEISKCQLFILVVGNNYGSIYHQDKQENKIPDSVTLREFRKALELKVYKHIFINKYVDYDYKNYKRALDKATLKYFKENEVADSDIQTARTIIKTSLDDVYHFPYESYKYVFYFLDIIHDLKENNAINVFETFADIKDALRKQWAGFMYESLTRKDKAVNVLIQPLENKIDKLEKSLSKLIETKTETADNKLTFDLSSLSREANLEKLETIQDKIQQLLLDIRYEFHWDDDGEEHSTKRVYFDKKFTAEITKSWLDSLKDLIQSFKWSKEIHVETVFMGFPLSKYNKWHYQIPYKTLFELYTLYNSLEDEDRNGFLNTVCQQLNENYDRPTSIKSQESVDDLPF
ncbi:MAG TPA: DUF4062 domain-containing protein [Ferruginibacter sp.]|jgi:hypothetical protein|nr:DUF4062 domain-containing protein [Ferruginibacter sp.]